MALERRRYLCASQVPRPVRRPWKLFEILAVGHQWSAPGLISMIIMISLLTMIITMLILIILIIMLITLRES